MVEKAKLMEIVGPANVINEEVIVNEYSKDYSFVDSIRPDFVIKPRNASDVEHIVKLANETSTPLVPVSSGFPHFRGDTVPCVGGAVIVDLSGMKEIIRVDRLNRSVMFEPGVTFGDLIPEVEKENLRLNIPLMPRSSKSVVGSMLEREPVIMPKYHWDISDPLSCVEIFFGSGVKFRTGSAAGPGSIEEQWAAGGAQKEGAGPSSASWYRIIQGSQGTTGIVTWASARCELLPRVEKAFFVGSARLDKIMDLVHWLVRLRLVNECFVSNADGLAYLSSKISKADHRDLRNTLPQWILFCNLAGYDYFPEERISGQIKDLTDISQRTGLEPRQAIGGIPASEFLAAVRHPSPEPYWKLRNKGACHDIFFLTIYDKLPGLINIMRNAADEAGYPVEDMGIYLQPIVQGTNCHCEFNLFYDPEDSIETDQVRKLAVNVTRKLMANGAFFSRPYGEITRNVVNNDAATAMALKKVKAIVDPNNIMNPGKLYF